mgnify:CR=1 FL=1
MQSERPRETFAALFARGWRIYAASFSASIAPSLLCFALPAALVSAVAYFAVVLLFQPALLAVRELVQALMQELGVQTAQQLETVPYHQLAQAYRNVSPALKAKGANVGQSPWQSPFCIWRLSCCCWC